MIRTAVGRAAIVLTAVLLPASLLLATSASAAGETATYRKSSDWGTGFEATYTITNGGTTTINSWTLVFTLGPNQRVNSLWNGTFTQDANRVVTVRNAGWNGTLAPGASASIGFGVAYSGTYADPTNCTINGVSCSGGPPPGPDTQAPTVPTGLASPSQTDTTVSLSWNASTDNVAVTGYDVFRGGTQVGTTAQTSFVVGGLAADTSFGFTVRARDAANNTSAQSAAVTARTRPVNTNPGTFRKVAYFTQWGIYDRGYFVKNIDTSGTAAKVDVINYAFANVNQQGRCFEANQLGQGDAWADYQRRFSADQTVNGQADTFNQPLAGNFNQLKQLKAKHPHLKVLMSLGGWTWSKWFSDAALTASSRQAFVQSCVDMFLRGNLPQIGGEPQGGAGSAAGVFDGFDLDWEWPGSEGNTGNVIRAEDKRNFTLLVQEFRRQLDALEGTTGRDFLLSAFLPADPAKISAGMEIAPLFATLDWATVQGYDLHGAWETTTNHQSNTILANGDPSPVNQRFSSDLALNTYLNGGAPPKKLILGVPFYSRGWTGVTNQNNGLFQQSTGAAPGRFEAGFEDYKTVKNFTGFTLNRDASVGTAWLFNGTTFWTFDDPTAVGQKMAYIKNKGIGGAMAWSLDGDDATGSLANAINNGLR